MGKYALLIGVGEYGEGLTSLPAAPRDVAAFTEVLQNPQMCGFDEVKPVINPNQAEMAREIELWFQGRQPDDLILLFFSGHGVKDDRRELFFAACNTEKQRDYLIRSTATSAQFIHDCIRRCKAKYQVIILDCCFSGAFGDQLARDDGEINLKDQMGAEGRVVLTATNEVGYAFEEKGADLSIYTRYLVEGIVSGAADEDEDGIITVEELHRFAGRKVEATSPAMSPKIITLKDEGYRIRLARSPQDDPKVKYRKEAERRAESGQFSIPARRLLRSRRQELGLSDVEVEAIEAEVLKPFQEYQRKRQEYEDTLRQCLEEVALSPSIIRDLMDFRSHLGLKLEDVAAIDQHLLGVSLENYQSEADRQREEQAQARHIEKLQQYREGFTKAIEDEYPLNQRILARLKQYQQQLELSDEDVAAIEKPIWEFTEAKYQEQLRVREEDERKQKAEIGAEAKAADAELSQQDEDDLRSEKFGANYYAKLRDLLAAQDWVAASVETYRCLNIVMDCDPLKNPPVKDIKSLPCQDLRNIDNLWVKYSKGQFGFSIQKEIYQTCTGKFVTQLTGFLYHQARFEKFGVIVGWRTAGWLDNTSGLGASWMLLSKITFNLGAPKGQLPFLFWTGHNRFRMFSSLMERIAECGI